MLVINQIRYKLENKIEIYIYTPLIFSETFFADNQSVFEDFNII